ncbi:TRAP transporter small permease [Ramlibacter tataouinensis]|uniref:TRAP transporter small permease protein n=1 Tax=Ramlibacter tataouinensis (strain ATCC BAA-407 / DSM 14655 / LMG 21543 / TTB310) TaxID=365046 RepID=F5Y205_RAMTT|nr:TRAP transporter small permease [Ramlibacter tataouinensis]AEG93589.1 Candidate small permease component [Ramlibacter tataouinensis TTB310]
MLRLLRHLTWAFAVAGATVALGVGLMTTVSVVGRAFFKSPIQGDVELTQVGIALAISLCLPWCQLRSANIVVDFFTQRLAPPRRRLLDAAGALLLALMCALLAWRTAAGAIAVKQAFETSMILGLPMWWAYASLAPGLGLAALVALVQAWMHLARRPMAALEGAA